MGWLCSSWSTDDTTEMIADMDKTYFEDEFLLPNTKSIDVKLSDVDPDVNPAGVLSKFWSTVHVGRSGRRDDEEEKLHIYYTVSNGRNTFFLHQAMSKYRDEIFLNYVESVSVEERERKARRHNAILREEFGGEIKIHHTNNKKLKKIGAGEFALNIQRSISLLREHLEEKQEKRKRGLGSLIRSKYVKGEPTR